MADDAESGLLGFSLTFLEFGFGVFNMNVCKLTGLFDGFKVFVGGDLGRMGEGSLLFLLVLKVFTGQVVFVVVFERGFTEVPKHGDIFNDG